MVLFFWEDNNNNTFVIRNNDNYNKIDFMTTKRQRKFLVERSRKATYYKDTLKKASQDMDPELYRSVYKDFLNDSLFTKLEHEELKKKIRQNAEYFFEKFIVDNHRNASELRKAIGSDIVSIPSLLYCISNARNQIVLNRGSEVFQSKLFLDAEMEDIIFNIDKLGKVRAPKVDDYVLKSLVDKLKREEE